MEVIDDDDGGELGVSIFLGRFLFFFQGVAVLGMWMCSGCWRHSRHHWD